VVPHLPVGVTLFFTLSGFLLYRPLVSSILNLRPLPDTRSYLRNRALRILPAYWAVLIATAILLPAVQVRVSTSDVELGRLLAHPEELVPNLLLMQNYFRGSIDTGIGPAWSLAVEVVFYLALPIVALVAAGIGNRTTSRRGRTLAVLVPPFLFLLVGSVAFSTAARFSDTSAARSILVRSFLNHADLFSFGMALAVVAISVDDGVLTLPAWWRKAAVLAIIALVAAIMILVDRGRLLTYRGAMGYETLTALVAVLLVAAVVLPSDGARVPISIRILNSRVVVAIGLASYSVFLWHEPLIRWLQARGLTFSGARGYVENLLLLSALTAVAAGATYRFVEKPALARKQRSASRDRAERPAGETAGGVRSTE
jgi:peptidoglycan/LPS O-acetylase OafA/YrhL